MRNFLFIFFFYSCLSFSQIIDTDSLLIVVKKNFIDREYDLMKLNIDLGLENSPDYLDYYLFRAKYNNLNNENYKAKEDLEYIIEHNSDYIDAYYLLISTNYILKNYEETYKYISILENKIKPQDYYNLLITFYSETKNINKLKNSLKDAVNKFEDNLSYKKQLDNLNKEYYYNKISYTYNNTVFDLNFQGPWHLNSLEFLMKRNKITLITRLDYTDRRSIDQNYITGYQFNTEAYLVTGKKSYSFLGYSFSNHSPPFPKMKLNYSYFRNYDSSYESETGIRYTKFDNLDLITGVIGLSKYYKNYMFSVKLYSLFNKDNLSNSIFIKAKKNLLNNKFLSSYNVILGYGQNPDERYLQNIINQRLNLNSFISGFGFETITYKNFTFSTQFLLNNQEYQENKYLRELNTNLSINYKF